MNIETLPGYDIIYMRQIGPYGIGNAQIMEKLKSWAKSKHLLGENAILLGIAQDNPETTKPEDCRYDTCLVVSEDYSISDDGISRGKLNQGKHAVFELDHTAQAVEKAWREIFQELFRQGYEIDYTNPIIERYQTKMLNSHRCEICVPIR